MTPAINRPVRRTSRRLGLLATLLASLLHAGPARADTTSSVIQDLSSFGWLDQFSLRDAEPDGSDLDAVACVPTSSINGMTFLQNTYGFYFNNKLTGTTYQDWIAIDAILVSPDYMKTTEGFGTTADRAYYGLNAYLTDTKGFDLISIDGMVPESVWELGHDSSNPALQRPASIVDAKPTLDYIEASLAAGNPTLISLVYPDGESGHALLVGGLVRNEDGTATLKVVDPLDPSATYPDGNPGGEAKFTDIVVKIDDDGNLEILQYPQYTGGLPYTSTSYSNATGTILAVVSINTRLVQDYLRSVAAAPLYFGQLPELALRNQIAIDNQLWRRTDQAMRSTPAGSIDAWASSGGGRTMIDEDSGSPVAMAMGAHWRSSEHSLLGAALYYSDTKPDWGQAGHYRQQDYRASLYGGYRNDRWTLAGAVSFGTQDYAITRSFQIGDTWRTHWGNTNGTSLAASAELGYELQSGAIAHGPFAQLSLQRIEVDGFSESAIDNQLSTTLQVGSQTRDACIGAIGWRAFWQAGNLAPYASISLNRDFDAKARTLHLASWAGSGLDLPTEKPRETYGNLNLGLLARLGGGLGLGVDLGLYYSEYRITDTRAMASLNLSL